MFNKIPVQYQRIIAIALPLISLIALYFLVVPRYQALKADEAELGTTNAAVLAKRTLIEEGMRQAESQTVIAQVPADRDEKTRFLTELNSVARSCGVRFTSITSTAAENAPPPTSAGGADAANSPASQGGLPPGTVPVALQMNVEGTYQSLALFFARLETYPRLISVNNVSMSSGQYPRLTAQFRMTRYTGPAPAALDPTPSS